jgi:mannose-6-phosphate isomerase-like protein (cupin superfamily)
LRSIAPVLVGLVALSSVSGGAAQEAAGSAPFVGELDRLAEQNDDFRHVLHTSPHMQLVVMSIAPGESIGAETHPNLEQCLFIVDGTGRAMLAGRASPIAEDSVVCVPPGVEHDIINTGREPMKLFTVYSPPQHAPGTVHHTRADAERAERQAHR